MSVSDGSLLSILDKADWEKGDKCYICDRNFTMRIRRHHCRFCKFSVCDAHSNGRRDVEGKKVRICDRCEYNILASEV